MIHFWLFLNVWKVWVTLLGIGLFWRIIGSKTSSSMLNVEATRELRNYFGPIDEHLFKQKFGVKLENYMCIAVVLCIQVFSQLCRPNCCAFDDCFFRIYEVILRSKPTSDTSNSWTRGIFDVPPPLKPENLRTVLGS